MVFRVFGIPTTVQFSFWFTAVLIGLIGGIFQQPQKLLVWVAIVFVSVLIHELGHAFAMIRYGLRPEITLHSMGGLTSGRGMNRLTRPRRIFISFAGPLAGFVFYGLIWGSQQLLPDAEFLARPRNTVEDTLAFAVLQLEWVNLWWGVFNLLPVLPLDGGHILEDVMGPRRQRLAMMVSLGFGVAGAVAALAFGRHFIAIVLGMCAIGTYQRYRTHTAPVTKVMPKQPFKPEEPVPPEIEAQLRKAKQALEDERYDEAGTLAELIIADKPPKRARLDALTVLAWAHLLKGRAEEAGRVVKAIARDREPDPALVGAVLFQQNQHEEARKVFEAARAAGDDRKEIVGPLIQILIAQGEVARAAAIALDIVESLSDEDVRQMAAIALEHEAYGWSARLYEALFDRTSDPDDAYAAARSKSLEGDVPAALGLLRRAVAAGFDDRKRAWSDAALEQLRDGESSGELEALLPRP